MKSPLTCVSGYWNVHNKHGNHYDKWFKNTLQINCPYVFFADKETIRYIQSFRRELPTLYIECSIQDFITYKYKDRMRTDPTHCPSVELNLIWHEKIFFIQKAKELNPFSSDFFCWVDAGICIYRDVQPPKTPFPNSNKLQSLPTYKFIYCSSLPYIEELVQPNIYYHHISGTYLLHRYIIDDFSFLYNQYLDKLLHKDNIMTDQVILTHIFKDNPNLFHLACNGYGEIINFIK